MSGRTSAALWQASAAREQLPVSDGEPLGCCDDPPPISGGDLSTVGHLQFEVADAGAVARAAAGHLRTVGDWLRQLPGRCRAAPFTTPGMAAAIESLRDIDVELDRIEALFEALSRLAHEAEASGPPAQEAETERSRQGQPDPLHDVDDSVDPASLPTAELVPALLRWAGGDYAREAAVHLLAGFGCPSGYWLRCAAFIDNCVDAWLSVEKDTTTGSRTPAVAASIDGAALASLLDGHHIKGAAGELRVLHLIAGLLGCPTPRPLSDQLLGLDEDTTVLVLRAVAHVGGWQERGCTFGLTPQEPPTTVATDVAAGVQHG